METHALKINQAGILESRALAYFSIPVGQSH
jgi:hypothetical protein